MAFEEEDLVLAFQLHVIDLVVKADLATTGTERELVDRWFPAEMLRERGFAGPEGGHTARFHDAVVEAVAALPTRLAKWRKLELLEACYRIATADREFRIGEGMVLLMASRLLGIADIDFDAFLSERTHTAGMSVAVLDRDDL